MSKLKELRISNTNVDSGLEYLPMSIENLRCQADKIEESKVKKLRDELAPYALDIKKGGWGNYRWNEWRRMNISRISKALRENEETEQQLLLNNLKLVEDLGGVKEKLEGQISSISLYEQKKNELEKRIKNLEEENERLKKLILADKSTRLNTILFPKYIYIKSNNEKFISKERGKNKPSVNRSKPDQHCLFLVENLGKSQVVLQTETEKNLWLTYNHDDSSIRFDNRNYQFNNQIFTIISSDSKDCVYLKSPRGFLSRNESDKLAIKERADESCKFTIDGAYISREIMNVECDPKKSIIREVSPLIALITEVKNPSSGLESRQILSYTYTKSEAGTWNNSTGIEIGLKTSFSSGVPCLVEGKVEAELGGSYSHEWGGSKGTERTVTSTTEIDVPAGKEGIALVTIKRAEIDVPFSYVERIRHCDGEIEDIIHKGTGIYNNLESYHVDVWSKRFSKY